MEPPDPVKIADYQAQYDVAANGESSGGREDHRAVPNGRHGIFHSGITSTPTILESATSPRSRASPWMGTRQPTSTKWAITATVAKIGDQDVLLTAGTHVYEIRYSILESSVPHLPGRYRRSSATFRPRTPPRSPSFGGTLLRMVGVCRSPTPGQAITLPTAAIGIACSASTAPDKVEGPCQITSNGTPAVGLGAKTIPPFGEDDCPGRECPLPLHRKRLFRGRGS